MVLSDIMHPQSRWKAVTLRARLINLVSSGFDVCNISRRQSRTGIFQKKGQTLAKTMFACMDTG